MTDILNTVSVTGTFLVFFGILYLAQRFTIGFIPFFEKRAIRRLTIGDLTFSITSLLFIFFYVEFSGPY